ncbi:GNAT family N-acetyltransferase [Sulfitobacter sp. JBTF-M27]|uniref:GNAT family N-acetyltransferase n=1 Tax=Sulfitobacter sediminilitoris TaxID=2698830 RepID=A0A6P0CET4_9RHOB|nr:GNAT family N-acetyltransferase [Sulfitobacter sediminilitoris]NEK23880.1 GNAT family N-acetyltransferase [Sulfitobacter sediminilitoris]
MAYRIVSVTEVDDEPAFEELLTEYYAVVFRKLGLVGGSAKKEPKDMASSVLANIQTILPPTGRLFLAYGKQDRLVGCGTLQQARPDAGELKRLFVRPEASGNRLGRALVDARMEAARNMGWRTLLVNAVTGNQDMLRIYESLGFRFIERYPECSDPIELTDYFDYMQFDFS